VVSSTGAPIGAPGNSTRLVRFPRDGPEWPAKLGPAGRRRRRRRLYASGGPRELVLFEARIARRVLCTLGTQLIIPGGADGLQGPRNGPQGLYGKRSGRGVTAFVFFVYSFYYFFILIFIFFFLLFGHRCGVFKLGF